MNYIKQLQDDVVKRQCAMEKTDMAIMHLAQYLESDKFHSGHELDNYVNIDDIKRYLIIIKDELHSEDNNYNTS